MAGLQYLCQTRTGTDIANAWNMPKAIGTNLANTRDIPNQNGTLLANAKSIPIQNRHRPCRNAKNIPDLLND